MIKRDDRLCAAFVKALKKEPAVVQPSGAALAATLRAYTKTPTAFMRGLLREDLAAFEKARSADV